MLKELVLPSGRFASMRPLMWVDRVLCWDENPESRVLRMACRVVRIDGCELTLHEAMQMTLMEANPLIEMVLHAWIDSQKSKGVA